MELVASGAETVVSYDPASGRELWRGPGVVSHPIPSPVAGHGMVFLSAGSGRKLALAFRLGGSGELTGPPNLAWTYDKGTAYVTSPILYGDYLYLVSDAGIITCLEAVSGDVKYQERVPVPASFRSSPVAFDDKILLSSEDGDTFVLRAGSRYEILQTNSVGEPIWASPALSQGQIFIRGAKSLFCIGNQE
jgi:outer membrane protein assembly factor BamB